MPNLQLFANAGFPFTRMADLSQTTVVLPANPTAAEIELYLGLMGHFGAQSGYPALRVTVAGPSTVISDNSDYLVIGTASDQPAFTSLNPLLPVAIDPAGFHLTHPGRQLPALANKAGSWWPDWLHATAGRNPFPIDDTVSDAMVEEIESPSSPQRSFVLIALRDGAAADPFSTAFVQRSQSDDMTHAVSLLRNGQFHSYSVDGATYHLGDISWFATMRIWLTQYFLLLLVTVTALSFLLARWMREWLMQLAGERLKLAEVNRTTQL
jgi:cellulose synthase (UDP-forming)